MNIQENNILCKCIGGSHLYGLNTPQSDEDIRFIYKFDNFNDFAGLDSNQNSHWQDKNDGKDIEGKEFRHCLRLLEGGNTQIIELLFNENWKILTPFWRVVQINRQKLINPKKLFSCLLGYINGERRLAFGDRTGRLGSKRKNDLDLYGFSPKNVAQLLRLSYCGSVFFNTGYFPTNIKNEPFFDFLFNIKTKPKDFNKDYLLAKTYEAEEALKIDFDKHEISHKMRGVSYKFCRVKANNLIETCYRYISL